MPETTIRGTVQTGWPAPQAGQPTLVLSATTGRATCCGDWLARLPYRLWEKPRPVTRWPTRADLRLEILWHSQGRAMSMLTEDNLADMTIRG